MSQDQEEYVRMMETVGGAGRTKTFNPLVFVLQLPTRFQKSASPIGGKAPESFVVMYDGGLLLIAAESRDWSSIIGFIAARDKFTSFLVKLAKFRKIPPTITHEGLVLVNGRRKSSSRYRETSNTMRINSKVALKEALTLFYLRFRRYFFRFYDCCYMADRVQDNAFAITEAQENLLAMTRKFMKTPSYRLRSRLSLSRSIRVEIADLLELLSEHRSTSQELAKDEVECERILREDATARGFLESNSWKRYTISIDIDRDSALTIVEYAKGEIESYRIGSTTFWAAIIGAIAGSISTLVVSYLI